jgi:hypothetical protein
VLRCKWPIFVGLFSNVSNSNLGMGVYKYNGYVWGLNGPSSESIIKRKRALVMD